jgi:hypothetical protein
LAHLSPIPEPPPEINATLPFISKDILTANDLLATFIYSRRMNNMFIWLDKKKILQLLTE